MNRHIFRAPLAIAALLTPSVHRAHPNHRAAPSASEAPSLRVVTGPLLSSAASLSVTILDAATGAPTPARVRITGEDGRPFGAAAVSNPLISPEIRLAAPGTAHYYRMLDLGVPLTAVAGSDFPWCGRCSQEAAEKQVGPQIGDVRFYTHVGQPFTFDRWLTGVRAGHTFVTTGPLVDFHVDGNPPGSTMEVARGAHVRITATARGHAEQVPLERLEIVGHGRVLATVSARDAGQSRDLLSLDFALPVDHASGSRRGSRARDTTRPTPRQCM